MAVSYTVASNIQESARDDRNENSGMEKSTGNIDNYTMFYPIVELVIEIHICSYNI